VAAPLPTLRLRVDVTVPPAGGVAGFTENAAVTPEGNPIALRVTAELKPSSDETVTVALPEAPALISRLGGVTSKLKSGAAVTVSVAVTVLVRDPETPCMVIVKDPVGVAAVVVTDIVDV